MDPVGEERIEIPEDDDEIRINPSDLLRARSDLRAAKLDEAAANPVPIEASWHFWKGEDWTDEEKRALRKAQVALVAGLTGGIGTLVASTIALVSSVDNLHAADQRLQTTNSTTLAGQVNAETDYTAHLAVSQTAIGVAVGGIAFFGSAFLNAAIEYYNVLEKHSDNVKNLNRPDVTKVRERVEARVKFITDELRAEQQRVLAAQRLLEQQAADETSDEMV